MDRVTKKQKLEKIDEEYDRILNSDSPIESMKEKLNDLILQKMITKGLLNELNEKMEDIEDQDEVMTIDNWKSCVKIGGFIDYDGWGYLATEKQKSNIRIFPSSLDYETDTITYISVEFDEPRFISSKIDLSKFTHVVWINR